MDELLGLNEQDLLWYQMAIRAALIFVIALVFIRMSGMRAFNSASAFDVVVSITLGGLLSRCIAGHYPFFTTLLASGVILICHQIVAYLNVYFNWFRSLTEGRAVCLFSNGRKHIRNMMRHAVSEADLRQALHKAEIDSYTHVKSIWFEVDGKVTVVKK